MSAEEPVRLDHVRPVQLRVVSGTESARDELARVAAIVVAAEALIREYDRRSEKFEHIALKQLRPLRDAVKGVTE